MNLIRVNKGSKRLMNLDLILVLEKTSALNVEVGESDEQDK